MKKSIFLLLFFVFLFAESFAQNNNFGIGTTNPNPSSKLDVVSSDKGVLIPRVALLSSTDNSTIVNGNVESLLVYNTNTSIDVIPGFYYWDGTKWVRIAISSDLSDDQQLSLNGNILTLEDGGSVTLPSADGSETKIIAGTNILINGTGTFTDPYVVENTFNETVTQFSQNITSPTGKIKYTDEEGNEFTANVISQDNNNAITVGSDGGAYFANPVFAMGKVNSDGSTTKAPFNATVTKITKGKYQISFTNAAPDDNYVIQLTVKDTEGLNNDNYDATYNSQTSNGFIVTIGDNGNGANKKALRDFEFMFTVLNY